MTGVRGLLRGVLTLAFVGATAAIPGGSAGAVPPPDLEVPRLLGAGFSFVPPSLRVPRGSQPLLTVTDPEPHNVVAVARDRRGPLFGSDTVGLGETTPVLRVERLGPGVYQFLCTVHERMTGELVVTA